MHDVLVVGAGPVGLACGIEAKRAGLDALIVDKGSLVNSIVGYPARMEFFSTPDLIEIGGYPFPIQGYKPSREEAVEYYRERSRAPGVKEGGTERNFYCMKCAGVIPHDPVAKTCPHCGESTEEAAKRYFNWVEINEPPRSDARALMVPVLWAMAGVGVVAAAVWWWMR